MWQTYSTSTNSTGGTTNIRITLHNRGEDPMASQGIPRNPEPPSDPFPDAIEVPFRLINQDEREPVAAIPAGSP